MHNSKGMREDRWMAKEDKSVHQIVEPDARTPADVVGQIG